MSGRKQPCRGPFALWAERTGLSGEGRFQVDDAVFDIAEGSVIRVATNCDRNLCCTSQEPLTYICIQAKEGSLEGYTMTDAEITERASLL